jgi:formylglycine-generating enzyme required for sulfatase activity
VDPALEALGSAQEELRLLRGGSWHSFPGCCRSAFRYHFLPVNANSSVGFRVVCLPQDPSLNPQTINPSTLAVA